MPDPRAGDLHMGPLGGIDQNAAVGVEQYRVTLGQNFEVTLVLEVRPCGAIG
jgi:hypothetical protein